jgi:cation/acetate symporter
MEIGNPLLNISIFGAFVVVTLVVVLRVSRGNRTASDYYAAGRSFSGPQNGVAIAGDYLSAASFLGIAGAIAVFGYDGFLYSIGFLVAWLVALLLVAEMLRNTGKFTMGDVLSFRMRQRPVRAAAATSTLVVSFFYLLAQMAGAGALVALLLQIPNSDTLGQGLALAVVGGLMIIYVLVGGMKGTTWVQIIKAGLLLVGAGVIVTWVLGRFGFNLSALLGRAVEANAEVQLPGATAAVPLGERLLIPGLQYGASVTSKIDFLSLGLALVLGTAGLPHILMRFYTVPNGRESRRSVVWAIWLIGVFYLFSLVLGFGASALVPGGAQRIVDAPGGTNSAAPLLAYQLGGELLLGIISAIAFATILAVVAGLTITASASFAHDVYANVIKRGRATPDAEVRVARRTALGIGVVAVAAGILARNQNVAFLVGLAFAVAASANLPTLLLSLFWRRFTTTGALLSIYGGLLSCVVLIVFSPAVSGRRSSMLPDVDFAVFPLSNPGLVSIPLSFVLGIAGSLLGPSRSDPARHAEMEVRALTGAGAEKAATDATGAPPPDRRYATGEIAPAPLGDGPRRSQAGRDAAPVFDPVSGSGQFPRSQSRLPR